MKCAACKPDYCACADFFASQLAYWRRGLPVKPTKKRDGREEA